MLIVSGSPNLQSSTWEPADSNKHTFDIVEPDNTADHVPTCTDGGKINLYNANIKSGVQGFLYTPCNVSFGTGATNIIWRGSLYVGGTISIGGSAPSIVYSPVTYPPGFVVTDPSSGGSNTTTVTGYLTFLYEKAI